MICIRIDNIDDVGSSIIIIFQLFQCIENKKNQSKNIYTALMRQLVDILKVKLRHLGTIAFLHFFKFDNAIPIYL